MLIYIYIYDDDDDDRYNKYDDGVRVVADR